MMEVDEKREQVAVVEKEASRRESEDEDPCKEDVVVSDMEVTGPGELSFEQATAGGMGRHLGVFSCTLLIVGTIIGTGIFSTPSSILGSVGSVGASLMLWVLGFVLSFCGLFIWLEFGTMIPRSGGEKVYLEAVYTKPKYLATLVYAANAFLLNLSSANSIVFAENILISADQAPERWVTRGIAVGVITFTTLLHGFTPKLGVYVMNTLGVTKIAILLFVVVTGWVVLSGHSHIPDPLANFRDPFAGSSNSSHDYATAMFKVLYAYSGWYSANYVLNNVKNPVRTLTIAGPLGLGICAVLYVLASVSYFAAATKEEIIESDTTVASIFFRNVFGTEAQKVLSVFVALSVITSMFSAARINQEIAKEGIPLPFGNRFWASNWPTGKAPLPGLIINMVPAIIVIIAPPPKVAYPFILDVQGYPLQVIAFFVVMGLLWMRWRRPDMHRPFKVWLPLAFLFWAGTTFLIVAPFLRPANGVGDTPPLPYYLYCLVGIGVLASGVLYWAWWRIVLGWFGYELISRREELADGTHVARFSWKKKK